jgi:hypothetical protein
MLLTEACHFQHLESAIKTKRKYEVSKSHASMRRIGRVGDSQMSIPSHIFQSMSDERMEDHLKVSPAADSIEPC